MSSKKLIKEKHNGLARILMIISGIIYFISTFMDYIHLEYYRDYDDYIDRDLTVREYTIYELESPAPVIFAYLSIALLVFGWFRARKGYSAKRYTWGSMLTQFIGFYTTLITSSLLYDTEQYYEVTYNGTTSVIYLILLGAIIAFIAGVTSKTKYLQIPIAQQGRMGFQPTQQFPYGQPQQQFPYQPPRSREVQSAPQQQGPPKKIVRCNTCGFNDDEGEAYCSQCGSKL
ncbi:MAG: hypothetical protein INQ03_25665 [Candidatus Heimdallarchaeota archaeon]|nr:hypothetical protein [Candidatus Heimdallarchaeota archaeon]